jgi:hypothetical protein
VSCGTVGRCPVGSGLCETPGTCGAMGQCRRQLDDAVIVGEFDPTMAKHALWLSMDELRAVVLALALLRLQGIPTDLGPAAQRVETMATELWRGSAR